MPIVNTIMYRDVKLAKKAIPKTVTKSYFTEVSGGFLQSKNRLISPVNQIVLLLSRTCYSPTKLLRSDNAAARLYRGCLRTMQLPSVGNYATSHYREMCTQSAQCFNRASAKRGLAIACRLSVRLSVCDVGGSLRPHTLAISETNCTDNSSFGSPKAIYLLSGEYGEILGRLQSTRKHLAPKPAQNTLNHGLYVIQGKVTHFGITGKPTRDCRRITV